jgi:hypothetical protein
MHSMTKKKQTVGTATIISFCGPQLRDYENQQQKRRQSMKRSLARLRGLLGLRTWSRSVVRLQAAKRRLMAVEDNLDLLAVGLDGLRQRVGVGWTACLMATHDKSLTAVADRNTERIGAHFDSLEARVTRLEDASHPLRADPLKGFSVRAAGCDYVKVVPDDRVTSTRRFKISPADRDERGRCDRWEIWELSRSFYGVPPVPATRTQYRDALVVPGRNRRATIAALRQQFPGCKITVCR